LKQALKIIHPLPLSLSHWEREIKKILSLWERSGEGIT